MGCIVDTAVLVVNVIISRHRFLFYCMISFLYILENLLHYLFEEKGCRENADPTPILNFGNQEDICKLEGACTSTMVPYVRLMSPCLTLARSYGRLKFLQIVDRLQI